MSLQVASGAGGTEARARLELEICRFELAVWFAKRQLFRKHLTLSLRSAPVLLVTVAEQTGLDLPRLVLRIDPPATWPARPLRRGRSLPATVAGTGSPFSLRNMHRRHRHAGIVTQGADDHSDLIGVRVAGERLEFMASKDGLGIETSGGLARLLIPRVIPDTLSTALIGRAVSDLVDHQWLSGRPWPIMKVRRSGPKSTHVIINSGSIHWRLPSTGSDLA